MANDDPMKIWQEQPVERMAISMDEIRQMAGRFESRIDRRNRGEYIAAAVVMAIFGFYFFKFTDLATRVGSALIVAGTIYLVVQLWRRSSPRTLPAELGITGSVEFYRGELVRQRDALRSVWRWYLAPLAPGLAILTKGKLWAIAVNASVFGGVWWMNQRAAAKLTRQIEELEK